MVKSRYISDILEQLLDGDHEGIMARQQLPFIMEDNFEYTGGRLFVRFSHTEEVAEFKVSKNDLILNGVKIQSLEFSIKADAPLFFANGLIDYLEIWCYQGNYPNHDLTKYTLTQKWNNSPNKVITTELE